MIRFDKSRYYISKDGGVYLRYEQIESLTEEILLDFNPNILADPQAVDYAEFLESYLEVDVDYQHIYTTGQKAIFLGAHCSRNSICQCSIRKICVRVIFTISHVLLSWIAPSLRVTEKYRKQLPDCMKLAMYGFTRTILQ